jgi:protein tyrosine/serine phosphatase
MHEAGRMMRVRSAFVVLLLGSLVACGAAGPDGPQVDGAQEADQTSAKPTAPSNFHEVRRGLYRGGHPSAANLDYLKALGVKTIVDLEVGDWIEAFPWDIDAELKNADKRGLTVVRKPMSAFEPALSDRFDKQMNEILALLADPSKAPIYVHCKHGQDRTGLVVGLERVLVEKWAPRDAWAEMLALGFHPMFEGLSHYFEQKTGYDP